MKAIHVDTPQNEAHSRAIVTKTIESAKRQATSSQPMGVLVDLLAVKDPTKRAALRADIESEIARANAGLPPDKQFKANFIE